MKGGALYFLTTQLHEHGSGHAHAHAHGGGGSEGGEGEAAVLMGGRHGAWCDTPGQ
eukprot:gene2560-5603_t